MSTLSGLRRPQGIMDGLFLRIWLLSNDALSFQDWLGKLYRWSSITLLRVLQYVQELRTGRSSIEMYCQEVHHSIATAESETTAEKLSSSYMPDRAKIVDASSSLFRLEVTLICLTQCQQEVYALLVQDDAPVEELSDIIFYKVFYRAAKFHGSIQIMALRRCLSYIQQAHKSTRSMLGICKRVVNWQDHHSQFQSISSNLRITIEHDTSKDKLSRGKHWARAGFQGEDPSTDFRGSGALGLRHLYHFCSQHPLYAQRMLAESGSLLDSPSGEEPWYPFALCSIHVTRYVCQLLENGTLERNLLQAQLAGDEGVYDFVDAFFCFAFVQCHLDWAEGVDKKEITSILQFEAFFSEFATHLTQQLRSKIWDNNDFHPHSKWW